MFMVMINQEIKNNFYVAYSLGSGDSSSTSELLVRGFETQGKSRNEIVQRLTEILNNQEGINTLVSVLVIGMLSARSNHSSLLGIDQNDLNVFVKNNLISVIEKSIKICS